MRSGRLIDLDSAEAAPGVYQIHGGAEIMLKLQAWMAAGLTLFGAFGLLSTFGTLPSLLFVVWTGCCSTLAVLARRAIRDGRLALTDEAIDVTLYRKRHIKFRDIDRLGIQFRRSRHWTHELMSDKRPFDGFGGDDGAQICLVIRDKAGTRSMILLSVFERPDEILGEIQERAQRPVESLRGRRGFVD